MDEIPNKDDNGCISIEREPGAVAMAPPHFQVTPQGTFLMMPAASMALTSMVSATGTIPAAIMYAWGAPRGLIFLMTPDEMRVMGQSMIDMANEADCAALKDAGEAIERARKGGA